MEGINKFTDCVLLVDDDPINAFFNAQLLSRLGIANTVKTASNALEAVDFIRQCCLLEEGELNSMLIFLDIPSTAYNGMELLNLVDSMTNKVFEKLEVIILTASIDEMEFLNDTEYNVLGIIEKPLSREKLEKLIAKGIQAE